MQRNQTTPNGHIARIPAYRMARETSILKLATMLPGDSIEIPRVLAAWQRLLAETVSKELRLAIRPQKPLKSPALPVRKVTRATTRKAFIR
ncbi:MAG: hypothetical protein EXR27_07510 [Betaproteobacteria bacterium]|nr:hypothetical protein [Betaproteobacteria bacterium]